MSVLIDSILIVVKNIFFYIVCTIIGCMAFLMFGWISYAGLGAFDYTSTYHVRTPLKDTLEIILLVSWGINWLLLFPISIWGDEIKAVKKIEDAMIITGGILTILGVVSYLILGFITIFTQ